MINYIIVAALSASLSSGVTAGVIYCLARRDNKREIQGLQVQVKLQQDALTDMEKAWELQGKIIASHKKAVKDLSRKVMLP